MSSQGTPLVVDHTHPLVDGKGSQLARDVATYWAVVPLFLLDAVCIALSMAIAFQVRFRFLAYHPPVSSAFYVRLVIAAVLLWEVVFAFYRLYRPEHLFGGVQEYGNILNGCTVGLVTLVVYTFFDRRFGQDISRGWLMIVWVLSVVSIALTRFGYRRIIYALRKRGFFTRPALVVGANQEAREVIAQLRCTDTAGLQVIGVVDAKLPPGAEYEGVPVLGDLGNLESLVVRRGIKDLIVIPTAIGREALLDVYQQWGTDGSVQLRLSSGLYELFTTRVQVEEVGFVPLVSLNKTRITGIDALTKALLDYSLAAMGLVFLAPMLFAIWAWIKLSSPGNPIYRRRVVGMHGKVFDAFKFRTMIADADAYLETHSDLQEEWEATGKIRDDPRITRIGRVLRRYSLDEIPQLINVLRGEMSLVGPRMITPEEQRHFGRWQHNRLTVKPGVTGLWQVSGRSDLSYEERVRLDMYYVRNHTVWLDLKLIASTASTVLRGTGAY